MIARATIAMLMLAGCTYTRDTKESRTELALFSNIERGAFGERKYVAPETVPSLGVGSAAWMDSWLAAWGIAVPSVVEVFRQPVENITTNTLSQ